MPDRKAITEGDGEPPSHRALPGQRARDRRFREIVEIIGEHIVGSSVRNVAAYGLPKKTVTKGCPVARASRPSCRSSVTSASDRSIRPLKDAVRTNTPAMTAS